MIIIELGHNLKELYRLGTVYGNNADGNVFDSDQGLFKIE